MKMTITPIKIIEDPANEVKSDKIFPNRKVKDKDGNIMEQVSIYYDWSDYRKSALVGMSSILFAGCHDHGHVLRRCTGAPVAHQFRRRTHARLELAVADAGRTAQCRDTGRP